MHNIQEAQDKRRSRIRNSALGSLTRREHAREELRAKLAAKFDDSEAVIAQTLDWLESLHYLDDSRFAEIFVRASIAKGRGPKRIKHELEERGVAQDIASRALDEAAVDWLEQAQYVLQKKFPVPPENPKEKARQLRFMQYRGFELTDIYRLLRHYLHH